MTRGKFKGAGGKALPTRVSAPIMYVYCGQANIHIEKLSLSDLAY